MDFDRRCTARNRRGERCRRAAIPGGTVCAMHGGKAPQVRHRANMRLIEGEARRLAALLDAGPVEDPIAALLDLAGQAVTLVDVLRGYVAELERVGYAGKIGEQVKAEIAVYLDAMARAESILANIVRLGLEERAVRLDERRVEIVVRVIEAVLRASGVDPAAIEVRSAVVRELEAVAGR
jgi:hypothetical protein